MEAVLSLMILYLNLLSKHAIIFHKTILTFFDGYGLDRVSRKANVDDDRDFVSSDFCLRYRRSVRLASRSQGRLTWTSHDGSCCSIAADRNHETSRNYRGWWSFGGRYACNVHVLSVDCSRDFATCKSSCPRIYCHGRYRQYLHFPSKKTWSWRRDFLSNRHHPDVRAATFLCHHLRRFQCGCLDHRKNRRSCFCNRKAKTIFYNNTATALRI